MKQKNIKSNLEDIYKETINKIDLRFGEGTLQFLGEQNKIFDENNIIKSGSYFIDKALGIGGYPKGRIIEIYGAESCGKTTIALKAVAECQKKGERAVYIDAEHALDSTYAQKLGVNLNEIVLCQPSSGEQTFSIIEALIKTQLVSLIVVDSVAALTPQQELNGDFDDQTIGLQARMMSKGLRIIQSLLTDNVTIIFINQIRDKIGLSYAAGVTTSGGRALKFFSSLRIEAKKQEVIKNNDEAIGFKIKLTVIKNKLARPLTSAIIDLYFNNGFNYDNEIIDIAINEGIINKSGSWYSYHNENIAQGKESMKKVIFANEELFNKIKQEILDKDLI